MAAERHQIVPYDPSYLNAITDLSILAWEPVFPLMREAIPDYVYDAFYPDGWKTRQLRESRIREVSRRPLFPQALKPPLLAQCRP